MLTKRRKKRGTIVKEQQIKSYCKLLKLNFESTTQELLQKGIIAKYGRNSKGYPYYFTG